MKDGWTDGRRGLAVLLAACLPMSALAENSGKGTEAAEPEEEEWERPSWLPDADDSAYDEASELDYEREKDSQFIPIVGGAWFGGGDGGAFTAGLGANLWQRWSSLRSGFDFGASSMLVYQGYDGAARGRSLRLSQRLVLGGGIFHARLGGDIATSRHRYDFRPTLDGVIAGGPAAEFSLLKDGSGLVGGIALDWFLSQGRAPQSSDSPLAEVCDEFRAHAGLAKEGTEFRYQLLWNAEGPTHAVVVTHPY